MNLFATMGADNMKWERGFRRVQLFLGLALTVFVAGIVVPSLVRSGVATREALAAGSLHTIKIAGFTFLFTYKNLVAAILGVLIGGTVALVIEVERARLWLRHVCKALQACVEDWGGGVPGGRSASAYIQTRMNRQAVPVVQNIRLAAARESDADRWIA
jgi:hypothetical protein